MKLTQLQVEKIAKKLNENLEHSRCKVEIYEAQPDTIDEGGYRFKIVTPRFEINHFRPEKCDWHTMYLLIEFFETYYNRGYRDGQEAALHNVMLNFKKVINGKG